MWKVNFMVMFIWTKWKKVVYQETREEKRECYRLGITQTYMCICMSST